MSEIHKLWWVTHGITPHHIMQRLTSTSFAIHKILGQGFLLFLNLPLINYPIYLLMSIILWLVYKVLGCWNRGKAANALNCQIYIRVASIILIVLNQGIKSILHPLVQQVLARHLVHHPLLWRIGMCIFTMNGKFATLTESFGASTNSAQEWFFTSMCVLMLF